MRRTPARRRRIALDEERVARTTSTAAGLAGDRAAIRPRSNRARFTLLHLGDETQARNAVGELLRLKPEFSIAFARERLFYLKRAEQIETYLGGLRKAGLS